MDMRLPAAADEGRPHGECDPCASTLRILCPDLALVRLDETTRDREPEAAPRIASTVAAPPVVFEDVWDVDRVDPGSRVRHHESNAISVGIDSDDDPTSCRR